VYLLIMLGLWCWTELGAKARAVLEDRVSMLSFLVILTVTVFFLILIYLAGPKWKAETRRLDEPDAEGFPVVTQGEAI
jgi:hypothetical protein